MKNKNLKLAIVTGGSSGMGLAIAKKLISNEIFTVIVSRSKRKVESALEELRKINKDLIAGKIASVSDNSQISLCIKSVFKEYGHLEYLINCAGVSIHGPFDKLTESDWDEVIDTNLKGVFLTINAAWPYMLRNKKNNTHIITISSASGITAYPTGSIYCASKAGLNSLMETLSLEGQKVGIKVTNIIPGQVDTPIWNPMDPDINKARKNMLNTQAVSDIVFYVLNRPFNEHFRYIVLHPFAIQPYLRGRNRGPGGKFPNMSQVKPLDKRKEFRI